MKKITYQELWPWGALAVLVLLALSSSFVPGVSLSKNSSGYEDLMAQVIPANGITLPVQWGDLGKQMLEAGVIDEDKFIALYEQRGGITQEMEELLYGNTEYILITRENSGFLLNLLWAFGLGNKNPILKEGPMQSPQYGGANRFASTGGWRLAVGDTMEHYSAHAFVQLTLSQQELVERVSKNIYRPCCNNATYFPDCNHGMAMLGLLELMAAQGIGEDEMYKVALQVNSYWFPDTYLTIAKYFEKREVAWKDVNPQTVLGSSYSSATGYQQILAEIQPPQVRGGSCGA